MKNTSQAVPKDLDFVDSGFEQLSITGNEVNAEYPRNRCIHDLFNAQVIETPDRIAVMMDDSYLTYRQLEEKSNQFARLLKERGVQPETLVGICLDRSLEFIIAILSILKAGGAYLPIDPDYPQDRIAFMLTDSKCPLLISQASIKLIMPETDTELIRYDEILPELSKMSIASVESNAKPNNLAYVIYTSGSTGKPKGVMIEHRNVVRLLYNEKFQFDFDEHDIWSIFHSFCFDFSVWEMFGALLFGGKAVIIPKEKTRDPQAFADLLQKERVTVVNQTPSAFYNLIPGLLASSPQSLFIRYVIFGGEKLNPAKLRDIKSHLPSVKFINMYGITETTVHVTYKEITDEDITRGTSNIGIPIPTLKVYIFDENMQLVPKGVEGELCVSGDGVARGYLNRSNLTREKFIPNPFNPIEIIYRSGDLACLQENGDLEYFGRMDSQIQLRGFRIELGEIESALVKIEGIEDCVVVVDEDNNEDHRIVAYYIAAHDDISVGTIRKKLELRLPDYMIPAFFLRIDQVPLTVNGKLDHKKLPPPDLENVSVEEYSAPQGITEETMSKIWGDILGIDGRRIGREYNFFEIGGHSLAVTTLSQRLREVFQKQITNQHIYESAILKDLCRVILKLDTIQPKPIAAIEEGGNAPQSISMLGTQLLCWLVNCLMKVKTSNVCEAYYLKGDFDFLSLQDALNQVVKHHDSLWYSCSAKEPLFYCSSPEECSIEFIDISSRMDMEERDLNALIIENLHFSFDFSRPPLFKMTVIRKGDKNHILLVSLPHIISDAASLNAFVQEVFDIYGQIKDNRLPIHLLRHTCSNEIITQEIKYLTSESCRKDKKFWEEKLNNLDFIKLDKEMFLSRGKPTGHKLLSKIRLNETMVKNLEEIARRTNSSVQSLILALTQATFHTLSGQDDISTAMVCDLRGLYAYSPVIQVNSTVINIRTDFSVKNTYNELISHLKWYWVDAHNHMQLPNSILFAIPVLNAFKTRPVLALIAKSLGAIAKWRFRKTKINKEILTCQIYYIFGMMSLVKRTMKRNKSKRMVLPIAFNVLPDFYQNRVLWSDSRLTVAGMRDRELTMDPHVYEERSRYQDAIVLNIDVLRDKQDQVCLYLWGGRFNRRAFQRIGKVFMNHLEKMTANPDSLIHSTKENVMVK